MMWAQGMLALAALFALLVNRNVPPNFPEVSSLQHSSVSEVANHNQRPRFDSNSLQWSAPVKAFQPLPPAAVPVHLASASQWLPTIHTKGFHYNRPPPVSESSSV